MKKISLVTAIIMSVVVSAFAQEYKLAVSGNKTLKISEVNKVDIEAYDGNEIIFTPVSGGHKRPERAEGLQAIGSMGLTDNSGIGLSVIEKGDEIIVQPMTKRSGGRFLIKVPKSLKIFYEHSTSYGSTFNAKDITSEIEVSTNHSGITLKNVTGPMTINTVHGKVEIDFSSVSQSGPISIVSVHGLIDVSLPSSTKAKIKMSSGWGELYTDMKIDFDQSEDELRSRSTRVSGTLNGGGVIIDLSSSHGDIFLRNAK